jgi:hypothetical protein
MRNWCRSVRIRVGQVCNGRPNWTNLSLHSPSNRLMFTIQLATAFKLLSHLRKLDQFSCQHHITRRYKSMLINRVSSIFFFFYILDRNVPLFSSCSQTAPILMSSPYNSTIQSHEHLFFFYILDETRDVPLLCSARNIDQLSCHHHITRLYKALFSVCKSKSFFSFTFVSSVFSCQHHTKRHIAVNHTAYYICRALLSI